MSHPVFARLYSRLIVKAFEKQGGAGLRRQLLQGLSGTVVEVGAGDGANFPHYPADVRRVLAVEPDPYLRRRATEVAPASVEVVDGDAGRLPIGDGEADAVVFCLVLCSVPDQAVALAEARRVLRPDGRLVLLEHVQAHQPGRTRTLQAGLDATVWPRLFGGCHVGRDTVGAVQAAGFDVAGLQRFAFPEGSRLPMSPAVIGTAVPV